MKRNSFILLSLIFIILMTSACKPFYQCGEQRPVKKTTTFFWAKRTKVVLDERDLLCKDLKNERRENTRLEKDTFELNEEIRKLESANDDLHNTNFALEAKLAELNGKYDALSNENISQAEQYNRALKQKSAELRNREALLEEQKALFEKQQLLLAEREETLKELQAKIARQDSITRALNDMIRKALLGFDSDELSVEVKNGKVYVSMSNKLLFKSGKYNVEGKGVEALEMLARVLNNNTDIAIMIEGHTDTDPISSETIKDNWALSTARANSIVRILTEEYEVDPTRVTAAGRGEFIPKASNETAEGKAINRRTEIVLSPNIEEIMKLLGN